MRHAPRAMTFLLGGILACLGLSEGELRAEFIPQLDLSGSFRRLDFRSTDLDQLGVASTIQPGIRPTLLWSTEGANPWRYRLFFNFEQGRYNLPATKLLQDGGALLLGAGTAVEKEWGRVRVGLGGQYEQKKAIGRDSAKSIFLSTVGIPAAFLDFSFIGIGTSAKTLRIGATGLYYAKSSKIPHDDLYLDSGLGLSIYWSYEAGETLGWGIQSAYTLREFTVGGGTMSANDFTIGVKFFVPHADVAKLPMDY